MQWIFGTAVMVALGSTGALAQGKTAATGWLPTLEVRGVQSRPESAQVLGDRKLAKGEPMAVTIWTGSSLCSVGIGEPPQSVVPANVWKMTGDYLGERDGRHQIRVTSGFTRLSGNAANATTTQMLTLREGDSVVLDALSEPVDASCPVHVVTLEARLVLQAASPALEAARYTADLWLIHTAPDGKEQREHLVMNVGGSNATPFMFNRLAFPIPRIDPRQGDAEAVIQLTGALRARPRPNGDISVDVDTNRILFWLRNPEKPASPAAPPLRMSFSTSPGETIAVDFPPPTSGYSVLALTADAAAVRVGAEAQKVARAQPTDAVQVKNDSLILYTFQFFKGHKTQLLITLKPLG